MAGDSAGPSQGSSPPRKRQVLGSAVLAQLRKRLGIQELQSKLERIDERIGKVELASRGPVYLGDHTALVMTRWGGMLMVDTRESVLAPALLLVGLWETSMTEWFQEFLRPGATFVDIGANIGYFSLLASQLVGPTGRVVSVEAHPRMVELLRRNMVVNGFGGVTIWQRAAWSERAKLRFNLRINFAANSSFGSLTVEQLEKIGDSEESAEVEAVPADELLVDLPGIDVIKVDVEGAEVHVFKGLERTLSRSPQLTVVFEWSPGQIEMVGNDPCELLDLLEGSGFGFRHIEGGMRRVGREDLLSIHHGNIVASRR